MDWSDFKMNSQMGMSNEIALAQQNQLSSCSSQPTDFSHCANISIHTSTNIRRVVNRAVREIQLQIMCQQVQIAQLQKWLNQIKNMDRSVTPVLL